MNLSDNREAAARDISTYTDARDAYDTWKANMDATARRFWSLMEERAFEEAIEKLQGDW